MEVTGGTLSISLKEKLLAADDLGSTLHMQPGHFLQLSIGDTGPGIMPEIRKRMFEPFFTTKEVGKGTGMGLAIIHGIVKNSGGFVSCHSQPGEGTVFHVFLPVIADTDLPANAPGTSVPIWQ
jgi:signal transduction histidine kinase